MALRGDQMNVLGPTLLVKDKTNVVPQAGDLIDGITGPEEDELSLNLTDRELLDLAEQWEGDYKTYYGRIKPRQDTNKKYYLGFQDSQKDALSAKPVPHNVIWEASETFYAQALARNPDPVVYCDNSDAGMEESTSVRTMLMFLADALCLRKKMTMMVRLWNVELIGVLKHGWDGDIHEISTEVRQPKNLILDPNGYVDCYGDFVGYIGENITAPAETLARMYEDERQYISELVEYKMGTPVTWTEWWTDEYTFTTFKKRVLDKSLNPHFNYPKKMPEARGDQVIAVLKEGNNHFARPKKPYTFLSVFSLQQAPHDETSLIEQNQKNQDLIVERVEQIAKAFRRSNNSIVFSEEAGYTQQTAKQALQGIEDGNGVLEPKANGVRRLEAPSLPAEFFQELEMNIEGLRSVYGTLGVTSVSQKDQESTARGMILNQQRSSDRIGGTIGDALNQVASNTFNWWTQLMHVYYDVEHTAAIMGKLRAVEEAVLLSEAFNRRLIVTAAPDSMKPKDQITEANQILSLYEAGLPVDPKTVLQLMDTPDVEKTIEGGILYKTNLQSYITENFPDLAQTLGMVQAQPGQAPGQVEQGQSGGNVLSPLQPQELSAPPANPDISQVPLPK